MSKILFLVNHEVVIYNFRLELIEKLLNEGNDVYISSPGGEKIQQLISLGCKHEEIEIERHGTNPLREIKLFCTYIKLLNHVKPDIVFTYTIKPNIYGGLACSIKRIPYVANITGLGISITNGGIMQKVSTTLYKLGISKAKKVFFQNSANQEFILKKIKSLPHELLPGSGVNLNKHCYEPYPNKQDEIIFLIIGRIMHDKGTDEILTAAEIIKQEFPHVIFRFIGFYDENYEEKINSYVSKGIIEYLGNQNDVHTFIKNSHATIHASHHEGMSNVLLETAASGRPILATNIPGCIETFDIGRSGIAFEVNNPNDLVCAIREFLALPYAKWEEMGKNGRKKMEEEFDRNIIVNKYLEIVKNIKRRNQNESL